MGSTHNKKDTLIYQLSHPNNFPFYFSFPNEIREPSKIFSLRMCVPERMKKIYLWFQQNSVALWGKDAKKLPCTQGQGTEDLHSHSSLALGALIDREEGDPDTTKHKHTECQVLGFIEFVRQISVQESYNKTCQGKRAQISQNTEKVSN